MSSPSWSVSEGLVSVAVSIRVSVTDVKVCCVVSCVVVQSRLEERQTLKQEVMVTGVSCGG